MRSPRPPVIVMLAGLKPACAHSLAALRGRAPMKFGTLQRNGVEFGVAVGAGVAVGVAVGVGVALGLGVGVAVRAN